MDTLKIQPLQFGKVVERRRVIRTEKVTGTVPSRVVPLRVARTDASLKITATILEENSDRTTQCRKLMAPSMKDQWVKLFSTSKGLKQHEKERIELASRLQETKISPDSFQQLQDPVKDVLEVLEAITGADKILLSLTAYVFKSLYEEGGMLQLLKTCCRVHRSICSAFWRLLDSIVTLICQAIEEDWKDNLMFSSRIVIYTLEKLALEQDSGN